MAPNLTGREAARPGPEDLKKFCQVAGMWSESQMLRSFGKKRICQPNNLPTRLS